MLCHREQMRAAVKPIVTDPFSAVATSPRANDYQHAIRINSTHTKRHMSCVKGLDLPAPHGRNSGRQVRGTKETINISIILLFGKQRLHFFSSNYRGKEALVDCRHCR